MTGKDDQNPPPRLRLSLRQLEVFVATARDGSTRAAAQRMARSQSAASAAIADLETALGVALFDRVGRRLVLNGQGQALLARASALLDQAGEIQALFAGGHTAVLRVAASFTIGEYLLPPLVARWRQSQPHSPVRLRIGNTTEVIDAVTAFEVDVGFIEGSQTHPDLAARPWVSDELVIVAAPGHPLAQHDSLPPAALHDAEWVLRERGSGTREAADRWLLEHLPQFQVAFELGSTEAVKRLVASGVGLGCVSRHAVAQALRDGWLVELRTPLPPATRRLSIVTHRDKRLGATARAFVAHCAAAREDAAMPPA